MEQNAGVLVSGREEGGSCGSRWKTVCSRVTWNVCERRLRIRHLHVSSSDAVREVRIKV